MMRAAVEKMWAIRKAPTLRLWEEVYVEEKGYYEAQTVGFFHVDSFIFESAKLSLTVRPLTKYYGLAEIKNTLVLNDDYIARLIGNFCDLQQVVGARKEIKQLAQAKKEIVWS